MSNPADAGNGDLFDLLLGGDDGGGDGGGAGDGVSASSGGVHAGGSGDHGADGTGDGVDGSNDYGSKIASLEGTVQTMAKQNERMAQMMTSMMGALRQPQASPAAPARREGEPTPEELDNLWGFTKDAPNLIPKLVDRHVLQPQLDARMAKFREEILGAISARDAERSLSGGVLSRLQPMLEDPSSKTVAAARRLRDQLKPFMREGVSDTVLDTLALSVATASNPDELTKAEVERAAARNESRARNLDRLRSKLGVGGVRKKSTPEWSSRHDELAAEFGLDDLSDEDKKEILGYETEYDEAERARAAFYAGGDE